MKTENWQAFVTVAVVVQQDGKYLCVEEVCKRTGSLVINQPAGHVEANETLVAACVRETLEETGWHIQVTNFLGMYSYQPLQEKTYYRFCFLADAHSCDSEATIDSDISHVSWYSLEELKQKTNLRSPLVLQCVQDAENGKRFNLDVIQEFLL